MGEYLMLAQMPSVPARYPELAMEGGRLNAGRVWLGGFGVGCTAMFLTVLGPLAMLLAVLIGSPLLLREPRVLAISGLLTGFGGLWTLLLVRLLLSGASQDNAAFWLAVGVVPLAVGLGVLGLGTRGRRYENASRR